jgi:MraZ protein
MMNKFLGNDPMTIDDKGRLGVPARFMAVLRQLCPDNADALGVMITPDRSVKIMPMPYFERALERLEKLDDQVDEERLILTLSTSMADSLTLDKQNRIKLNPMLMEICGLDRQVVVVGNLHYMQVFDLRVWRETMTEGIALWSSAQTRVAKKDAPPAPVQYVIQTGGDAPDR